MKKIILLGLNELNFDYVKSYIKLGELQNFKKLFSTYGITETTSESEYKLLEPWIQWVTVTTGKTYDEHEVFRLGDIVNRKDLKQVFEIAEEKGLKVGAVSPFNVDNRLENPSFFVPDPWTKTRASGSWLIRKISKAVSQTVNDNAKEKVSKSSLFYIFLGLIRYVKLSNYNDYINVILGGGKGSKAVVLDKLLSDVFISLWKRNKPDFSNLFLNTGAHFQHHYMFNSKIYKGEFRNPEWYCPEREDPLFLILAEYDRIIGRLLEQDVRLIVCTGLHQKPHKHNTFYWRLNDHENFLKNDLGITDFENVIPRMSRDFLIEFISEATAKKCEKILEEVTGGIEGETVSEEIFKVDNRGKSLFVELVYPNDIASNFNLKLGDRLIKNFKSRVAFVAIKNGEHHNVGYLIDTKNPVEKTKQIQLKSVFNILVEGFNSLTIKTDT